MVKLMPKDRLRRAAFDAVTTSVTLKLRLLDLARNRDVFLEGSVEELGLFAQILKDLATSLRSSLSEINVACQELQLSVSQLAIAALDSELSMGIVFSPLSETGACEPTKFYATLAKSWFAENGFDAIWFPAESSIGEMLSDVGLDWLRNDAGAIYGTHEAPDLGLEDPFHALADKRLSEDFKEFRISSMTTVALSTLEQMKFAESAASDAASEFLDQYRTIHAINAESLPAADATAAFDFLSDASEMLLKMIVASSNLAREAGLKTSLLPLLHLERLAKQARSLAIMASIPGRNYDEQRVALSAYISFAQASTILSEATKVIENAKQCFSSLVGEIPSHTTPANSSNWFTVKDAHAATGIPESTISEWCNGMRAGTNVDHLGKGPERRIDMNSLCRAKLNNAKKRPNGSE